MAANTEFTGGYGLIELLQAPSLDMTADAMLEDFTHYFGRMLGRQTIRTKSPFLYQAVVYAARDRLMERWAATRKATQVDDTRRVSYLSLEYLMGRLLRNALLNLGVEAETSEALEALENAAGFLRSGLARRLRLRAVPDLKFRHDTSLTTGERVSALIERALAGDGRSSEED